MEHTTEYTFQRRAGNAFRFGTDNDHAPVQMVFIRKSFFGLDPGAAKPPRGQLVITVTWEPEVETGEEADEIATMEE